MASSSSTGPRKFAWKKDKTRVESILKLPLQQITVDTYDVLSKKIVSSILELELETSEHSEIVTLFLQGYTSEMYCDMFAQLLEKLSSCSKSMISIFQDLFMSEIKSDCAEDSGEEQIVKYSKRRQDLCALIKSCLTIKLIEYSFYSEVVDCFVEKLTVSTVTDLQSMFMKCIKELSVHVNDIDFSNIVDTISPLEAIQSQSVIKFTFQEMLQRKPKKKSTEVKSQKKIREQWEQENESNKQYSYNWIISNLQKQIESQTDKAVVYNFLNDINTDDSTRKHIKVCMSGKKSNEKWALLKEIVDATKKRMKPKWEHVFNYKPPQKSNDGWETIQKHKKPPQSSFVDPTIQSDYLTVFLATVTDLEKRQKTKAENLAENRQLIINFIKHRHTQRGKSKEDLKTEIGDLEKGTRIKDMLRGIEKTIKYFIADNLGVEPEVLGNEPYTSEQKELIANLLDILINEACANQ